jgi:membrane protein DedA with SNARE-associated domain/rhodanese-related sulfurtransferase
MWYLPSASSLPTLGAWAVFASVFLTQLGVPLPAAPMLILAGTMATLGQGSLVNMLAAAISAVLIADTLWFIAGRYYGRTLLNSIVRFSLSLDNTLRRARNLFEHHGAPVLALAKFVPGLGLISAPLMGTTSMDVRIFWLWDLVGATLWASFYLMAGAAFVQKISDIMLFVQANGWTILDVGIALCLMILLYRWGRRLWFRRWMAKVRISPAELDALLRSASPPILFDARPASVRKKDAYGISGAIALDLASPDPVKVDTPARSIVIYCVCPNEATAKLIARQLHRKGIHRVHALRGGLDAWLKWGYPVEPIE